jgi:SAM-dependent methyltransferase
MTMPQTTNPADNRDLPEIAQLYELTRQRLFPKGFWGLFYAHRTADEFQFGGFAIPPLGLEIEHHFAVNGVPARLGDGPHNPGVDQLAQRFGLTSPYGRYAVHGSVPLAQLGAAEEFQIEYRDRSGAALNPFHNWWVPTRRGTLAATAQRVRVAATSDPEIFDTMGYSAFRMLEQVLGRYFGRSYDDCGQILDWGCGCGRVARFFTENYPGKLTGIDIDPDNVAWCAANLSGGAFQVCGLNPPTVLPNENFDLIYGISVFTHLGVEDQFAWLAELARVAKPGAAVLVSVHGTVAFCRADSDLHRFLAFHRDGFFNYSRCPDLDDVLPEMVTSGYYKNVFHTTRYVHEQWSGDFEILAILEGTMAAHQDLVVMRRR